MSLKAKLATTLAALCMVICLLTVGVWAAAQINVTVSGSVSFAATDVWAKVSVKSEHAAEDVTEDYVIFNANPSEDEDSKSTTAGTTDKWGSLSLQFDNATKADIVITIKVENLHEENALKVTVADKYTHEGDAANNIEVVVVESAEGGDTLNKVGGATVSKTYTITLKMVEKNKSVVATNFGVDITLNDAGADA